MEAHGNGNKRKRYREHISSVYVCFNVGRNLSSLSFTEHTKTIVLIEILVAPGCPITTTKGFC